jgi:hypothetical protein
MNKEKLIVDDELNIETIEELLTITNYDTKQLTMDKKHLMFRELDA